jgi:hypothetical protein
MFLGDFSFVRIFLKNYRVTMTTTLELHVRKIQWFCQQGEGFCMHVFSSTYNNILNPRADGAKRRARVLIPPGYLHPGKRKH